MVFTQLLLLDWILLQIDLFIEQSKPIDTTRYFDNHFEIESTFEQLKQLMANIYLSRVLLKFLRLFFFHSKVCRYAAQNYCDIR